MIIDGIQEKVCLERRCKDRPAQSLTLSLCSLSAIHKALWHHHSHHQEWKTQKEIQFETTCDSINISYRNDPEQVFP